MLICFKFQNNFEKHRHIITFCIAQYFHGSKEFYISNVLKSAEQATLVVSYMYMV